MFSIAIENSHYDTNRTYLFEINEITFRFRLKYTSLTTSESGGVPKSVSANMLARKWEELTCLFDECVATNGAKCTNTNYNVESILSQCIIL